MAGIPIEIGMAHRRVAANVTYWRIHRRMTLVDLSAALRERGRHIPENSLSRIATGERRIDVDDLVALADVLGTDPCTLLTRKVESAVLRSEASRLLEEADAIDQEAVA